MADITDIKSILYTEKSLELQERGVVVIQTSNRMTKNSLKVVLREYFGVAPLNINSLRVRGKAKKFKGIAGRKSDYKKFYVTLPEGSELQTVEV